MRHVKIIDKSNVRKEDLDREDIVVIIDEKLKKMPKFLLGKKFLKRRLSRDV